MGLDTKGISGYTYGSPEASQSAVSMDELNELKISAGFTEDDQHYLRLAGEVLGDQTQQIVDHWGRAGDWVVARFMFCYLCH